MSESAWDMAERRARSVTCPTCAAAVGAPCRDLGAPGRYLFGNRVHLGRAQRLRRHLDGARDE